MVSVKNIAVTAPETVTKTDTRKALGRVSDENIYLYESKWNSVGIMKNVLVRISFSEAKEQPSMYRKGRIVITEIKIKKKALITSKVFDCHDLFIFFHAPTFLMKFIFIRS
jgi:hypothetical protein